MIAPEPPIRQRLPKRAVIHIDLLGFSEVCSASNWETRQGIQEALKRYEFLRGIASGMHKEGKLERVFFFSDSVFLTCADLNDALNVAIAMFQAIYRHSYENQIPAMVRGGLGFGDLFYDARIELPARANSSEIGNLLGPAVVEAVQHERKGAGPRLFCSAELSKHVTDPFVRSYITDAPETEPRCDEILWGAVKEAKVFEILWNAYDTYARGLPSNYRKHYVEGIRFAIRCLSLYHRQYPIKPSAAFEAEIISNVLPRLKTITNHEDWACIDETIRWELAKHEKV